MFMRRHAMQDLDKFENCERNCQPRSASPLQQGSYTLLLDTRIALDMECSCFSQEHGLLMLYLMIGNWNLRLAAL